MHGCSVCARQELWRNAKCSQGTVANWVKEVGFRKEMAGLRNELGEANEYIESLADQLNLIEYAPQHDDDR